jgi:hypothetical protein
MMRQRLKESCGPEVTSENRKMDFDEFDIFGQGKLPHQEFTRIFEISLDDVELSSI